MKQQQNSAMSRSSISSHEEFLVITVSVGSELMSSIMCNMSTANTEIHTATYYSYITEEKWLKLTQMNK